MFTKSLNWDIVEVVKHTFVLALRWIKVCFLFGPKSYIGELER